MATFASSPLVIMLMALSMILDPTTTGTTGVTSDVFLGLIHTYTVSYYYYVYICTFNYVY